MAENEGSAVEKLTFLLIGAGIGAVLALLFAPKSGRELRSDIADVTKRGFDAATEGARAASARAGELYESGREKVADALSTARERVSHGADAVAEAAARRKEQIAAAIEAGRQAYQEEKKKGGEMTRAAVEGEEA
jgi:gas vesicle protein